ncbi:carbamoyl-phosphate synthase (glutamine-hydrolyzing) large subunit [Candidatus Pacebacteria bacterium]|nr:carbamoyl-phosphate synthase (glutamine-hydrolyzing) large subunit [Candidatus Paceibacterota bacterium]
MKHATYTIPNNIKKVLVLGSGGLRIGQAGEFDYSGSQALKALKEEGIEGVVINPNIATVQTDPDFADKVYFLPVTPDYVEKVIERERPEGIFLSFGGQTALNCGIALEERGILKKYNVAVLGTPVDVIDATEDREKFNAELKKIDIPFPKSIPCRTKAEGIKAAEKLGYPVLVRAAFALGGLGSGHAKSREDLDEILDKAFAHSPQVLVEENLTGWKELEYELVRDKDDNAIAVCNMENFDPLGIHTGESIVVSPSQTLDNHEYHMLREAALRIVRHFGIVGECNVQFTLDPHSRAYKVIELNARLSRSSALASKATGYPLAFVAAKIGLGYRMDEIPNAITKVTTAFFEPSLDYLVVKYPRWDLEKFDKVDSRIGSEMKSVGEVMSIGRNFEEAIQKAIRCLAIGADGFTDATHDAPDLKKSLSEPTHKRMFAIARAFEDGLSVEDVYQLTKIDRWFLEKLHHIYVLKEKLQSAKSLSTALLTEAKQHGFSDRRIAELTGKTEAAVFTSRAKSGIVPIIKQIDTLAAEFPAQTNYLYTTYHGQVSDVKPVAAPKGKRKILVIGSGPYCIGSSVEFDWSCVNVVKTLRRLGHTTMMLNYNPETVSTDYDMCDSLYFDEISVERIKDICAVEQPDGVIISMGGQIANNIAMDLKAAGIPVLGTDPSDIDRAEDRNKFSSLLDELGIDQPAWTESTSTEQSVTFANEVGYPVIVRPSYVLSGAAMRICYTKGELTRFLEKAGAVSKEHPVVVSKFEDGAKEIEIDGVAQDGKLQIYAISEHIQNAGVHSGDASVMLPPQQIYVETMRQIKTATKKIVRALKITGPFNIQFLARDNHIKVIECNLRASRSFPFVSKVTGYNFIDLATQAFLGTDISGRYHTIDLDHVGIKVPQFSFSRLKGADPTLGVEMASTGEVASFGEDKHEAFLLAFQSAGNSLPKKGVLVSFGPDEEKLEFISYAQKLTELGYPLYATAGTARVLKEHGVKTKVVKKLSEGKPNTISLIESGKIDLVINTPNRSDRKEKSDGFSIRRKAVDAGITLINDVKIARALVGALIQQRALGGMATFTPQHHAEYMKTGANE